jgi:hypothetical protein
MAMVRMRQDSSQSAGHKDRRGSCRVRALTNSPKRHKSETIKEVSNATLPLASSAPLRRNRHRRGFDRRKLDQSQSRHRRRPKRRDLRFPSATNYPPLKALPFPLSSRP